MTYQNCSWLIFCPISSVFIRQHTNIFSTKTDKNHKTNSLKKVFFHPEEWQSAANRAALLELLNFQCLALGHFSRVHSWRFGGFKLGIWVKRQFPKTLKQPASKTSDVTGQRSTGHISTKKPESWPLEMAKVISTYLRAPFLPSFLPPVCWTGSLGGITKDIFTLFICRSLSTAVRCPVLGGSWTNELLAWLALGGQTQNGAGICVRKHTHTQKDKPHKNTSSQTVCQILHFNLIKPSPSGSVPFVLFSLSAFSLQEAGMCVCAS